jgi:glucose/arabinose dehydrogenase
MAFYTGDKFPEWKGNIFIGALPGEQVQLVVMNRSGRCSGSSQWFIEAAARR